MLARLDCQRAAKERFERKSFAQRSAQVDFFLTKEAHAQPSVRREPHPIATAAITVGHRRDDYDRSDCSLQSEITSRTVAPDWADCWRQRRDYSQTLENFVAGDDPLRRQLSHLSDGHQLDEAYVPVVVERQTPKILELVVVDATHHHDVELDRRQPRALGDIRRGDRIE